MQTDPNWGNFLYDPAQRCLNLIDFGAAREFPVAFVDDYVRMVRSCALKDGDDVILRSTRLGFLTGRGHCHLADPRAARPWSGLCPDDSLVFLAPRISDDNNIICHCYHC